MERHRWRRAQSLFFDLLEIEAERRPARLEQETRTDPDLRAEVSGMLRAHEAEFPLRIEERLLTVQKALAGDLEGQRLGVYMVGREIGRGGMGAVYLAERVDQYRQHVALKVLAPGLRERGLEERFRRERQILAHLTHPNIAQILDGGVTEDGRPYLVMPYVEGRPITAYCDAEGLDIRHRLELFCTVCRAVDHAHRSLVVHCDLKPSNILIEADGEVKLLDFGIAKLLASGDAPPPTRDGPSKVVGKGLGQRLDAARDVSWRETTTHIGFRLLTPEYAAPEQVLGRPVTTATDTWALGVLLYELLAGCKPFSASDVDLEAAICGQEPASPSRAVRRQVADGQKGREAWTSRLQGDLDAIVLRALSKEPEARYGSAEQLSEEIRRFLNGEPVRARPDTFRYRARCFVRRHRWQAAAVAAFVLLLMSFAATSGLQSRALQRQRDAARLERDTSEQVSQLLVDLFETTDPKKRPGSRAMTVEELLGLQAERVVAGLEGHAVVQARMRHILGTVYRAHSRFEESRTYLHAALDQQLSIAGWSDPTTLAIYQDLAIHEADFGHRSLGERMLRHSLDLHRAFLGPNDESIPSCLEALANRLPPASPERSQLLAEALQRRRKLEPVPGLGTAESLNNLGLARLAEQQLDEALRYFHQSSELVESLLGESHPFSLVVQANISATLTRMNRYREAQRLDRLLVDRSREIYGPESTELARALNNLGATLAAGGRWEEARSSLEQALKIFRQLVGGAHPELGNTTRNLAYLVEFQGNFAEAQALLAPLAARAVDGDPRGAALTEVQLAGLLLRIGETEAAIGALEKLEREISLAEPPADLILATAPLRLLGEAYLVAGRFSDSEQVFRRLLERQGGVYEAPHPLWAGTTCGLASALAGQHKPILARDLFGDCFESFASWGWANPATIALFRRAADSVGVASEADPSGSPRRP